MSAAAAERTFEITPAVRKSVGLLIGLVGPSSSGKTYSALRLASGIQRVCGGDIDFIDTENGRALYYADKFKFNHLRFAAPFSPLDYLAAIRACVKRGAKTIVIDSMSHEHEGPGGVLEWHEREAQELARRYNSTPEKMGMAAWGPPKTARRMLINEILQMNVNLVLTFRAKEKIKIVRGEREPKPLGWQPICGEEYVYEMSLQALLPPSSEGYPVWTSELDSERAIMKLPSQFKSIFEGKRRQLDEGIGEELARWAAGAPAPTGNSKVDSLVEMYESCDGVAELAGLEATRKAEWEKLTPAEKRRVKDASEAATKRIIVPGEETEAGARG